MTYLEQTMQACAAHIEASGIVPQDSVIVGYTPDLETIIDRTLGKLNLVVLLHDMSITSDNDDNHTASFLILVEVDPVLSNLSAARAAEGIYQLLNGFNPSDLKPIPYFEIVSKSFKTLGNGVCAISVEFDYNINNKQ